MLTLWRVKRRMEATVSAADVPDIGVSKDEIAAYGAFCAKSQPRPDGVVEPECELASTRPPRTTGSSS